jgi:hypothetical protein
MVIKPVKRLIKIYESGFVRKDFVIWVHVGVRDNGIFNGRHKDKNSERSE